MKKLTIEELNEIDRLAIERIKQIEKEREFVVYIENQKTYIYTPEYYDKLKIKYERLCNLLDLFNIDYTPYVSYSSTTTLCIEVDSCSYSFATVIRKFIEYDYSLSMKFCSFLALPPESFNRENVVTEVKPIFNNIVYKEESKYEN